MITDLQRQREQSMKEVAELKVQLKMVEETRDAIRRDLIDANRNIREGNTSTLIPLILLFLCSSYVNFHPLQVVSHYYDPELQACEKYSYLFHSRPNICRFVSQ